jgi:hypothetical protein
MSTATRSLSCVYTMLPHSCRARTCRAVQAGPASQPGSVRGGAGRDRRVPPSGAVTTLFKQQAQSHNCIGWIRRPAACDQGHPGRRATHKGHEQAQATPCASERQPGARSRADVRAGLAHLGVLPAHERRGHVHLGTQHKKS